MEIKNLGYGAVAGAISRTFVAPLERLKVINQVRPKTAKVSILKNLKQIFRQEGLRGMFSGNLTNCIRVVPKSGIQFMAFNWGKKYTESNFLAGAIAGVITATSVYPLEVIRTRLSVQKNNKKYNGIIDCSKKIYRIQGIKGFYRGLQPCLIGVVPLYSINFGLFKYFQEKMGGNTPINNLIAGSFSMLGAISVAFPSDLVKKRIQMRGEYGVPNYPNFIECIKDIAKREGVKGFYHGIKADYIKMLPANGMYFLIIGLLQKYM